MFPCNDGVQIPAPIRICLDIIENKGIDSEVIYRRSVNKVQLEAICESINDDKFETRIDELNADPNLACKLIIRFLRRLKTPVVSDEFLNALDKCDANISDKEMQIKIEYLKKLINRMSTVNRDTFTYFMMHFHKVLSKSEVNKIEIGYFVQKFQPIFRIRERLFKMLIIYADDLFRDYRFKKYRIKTNEEITSRFSMLPDTVEDLEKEISQQEVYLLELHKRIAKEESSNNKVEQLSEELWSLQRYVTSLKRKLKKIKTEKKLQLEQEETITQQQTNTNIRANIEEALSNEMNLLTQNFVLIETLKQLFDKMNKETSKISEIHSIISQSAQSAIEADSLASNVTNIDELYEKEKSILNDNKLLEVKKTEFNFKIDLLIANFLTKQ
jgi:RalA-binding protein 1